MTTAEALEGMTDPGEFEILATRTLREIDTDCKAVVHVGVNAQGKTVANPIDAFSLVPGSNPPRYVMAAFTLTATDGLRRKWLFDHTTNRPTGKRKATTPSPTDDGDLIKAGREAAAIRARHPDAMFVIWLCTNRRLDNELQQLAYDKAAELGIEVRFLEQSGLRDFLDVKPEGQWLRQEHLGIEADQISASLLRKLSQESVGRYAHDLLLPSMDRIVATRAARTAAEALRTEAALHLFVGPSGVGKSVIAHDLLRRHIDGGGIGLWIPGEVGDKEPFLTDAVDAVLRSLHPRACVGAGHEAVKLGTADQPLLLIVDDVNRSPDPARLLRKVIGWSRPGGPSDRSTAVARSPVQVICPTWEAYWYPLRHTHESMSWIRIQGIGAMARSEAVQCLKAALGRRAGAYTDTELGTFAERLHDDPILLGLFGTLMRADSSTSPLVVSENVIGRLIRQAIGELAVAHRTTAADYSAALNSLSKEIIRKRILHPRWSDVPGWFEAESAVPARLGELAAHGYLCRLTEVAGPPRLEFRHDRILEYHVVQAASEMLRGDDDERETVVDPFFTPFVGRAIARVEMPRAVLEWARQQNPVALVAAVPYLPTSQSTYADEVVHLARAWLRDPGDFPVSMRYDAWWTLARASSPRVLDVTEEIPGNRLVWEARLRNGDAVAGALALSADFFPAVRFAWLESVIEEARTHHGTRLTGQLRTLLRSTSLSDEHRYGALCLAGYLSDSGLAGDVRFAWENSGDRRGILLAALWAGFRCAGDTPADLVGPMMPLILELQKDESGRTLGERESLLEELRFASRHGFGEPVLSYLVELGTSRDEFRWIVVSILNDIDHPIAIRYAVRLLAEAKHNAEQAGGFSPWAEIWRDRWERGESGDKRRLSPASVAALRSLWADEQNPAWLQKYAFSLWARHVDSLDELAAATPESQHYENAVWQRALRGDRAVAGYVLDRCTRTSHWFHVAPRVWGTEFEPVVDAVMSRIAADPTAQANPWSDRDYETSRLLRDMPTETAERLLGKHWASLGLRPLFIQAALYHGTARCRELASRSFADVANVGDPFEHLGSFFGFSSQDLRERITERQLETLRPYLGQLDDVCLSEMLEFCRRFDHWAWATRHLEPELRRRVVSTKLDVAGGPPLIVRVTAHWFPTDGELLSRLDHVEQVDRRDRGGLLARWWDDFVERGDPDERPGQLLSAWVARDPSPSRFVAAADLVGDRGRRRDLEVLLRLKPAAEDPETTRAASDAEFAVKRRSLE